MSIGRQARGASMRKPRSPAWMVVYYTYEDVMAFKALAEGVANGAQQRHALEWILKYAAGVDELSYRSDADGGDRETAFAEGRRFVGLQINKMVKMAPAFVAKLREQDER